MERNCPRTFQRETKKTKPNTFILRVKILTLPKGHKCTAKSYDNLNLKYLIQLNLEYIIKLCPKISSNPFNQRQH